jgi:hypothetical protein
MSPIDSAKQSVPWRGVNYFRLIVWAAAIIGVSVLSNQWLLAQNGFSGDIGLVVLAVFVIGVPLVFGALAGWLIRRDGPAWGLLLIAAVGAACIALALYVQWVEALGCAHRPRVPIATPVSRSGRP